MPRKPKYSRQQSTIRDLLAELGHIVVLRDDPQPSVFLDHEPSARFYGIAWPLVHADVIAYFVAQKAHMKPKTLA